MSNGMADLNDLLFDQLNKLADKGLSEKSLGQEINRATAMVAIADRLTDNAELQLKAAHLFAAHGERVVDYLPKIGHGNAGGAGNVTKKIQR